MTKAKLSIDRLARLFGILVGVAVAVVALIAWRVPGGERTLGSDVRIEALQTGEIGVAPLHPFVSAPSLLPGSSVAGDVTVRNQTGVPLALRLRAPPPWPWPPPPGPASRPRLPTPPTPSAPAPSPSLTTAPARPSPPPRWRPGRARAAASR